MGISNWLHSLFRGLCWPALDVEIDGWIREALLDDALAKPPTGAWERLRHAIIERKLKHHGMWVLDEPHRDPPEALPMMLDHEEFERAQRLYGYSAWQDRRRYELWSGLVPGLEALVNW